MGIPAGAAGRAPLARAAVVDVGALEARYLFPAALRADAGQVVRPAAQWTGALGVVAVSQGSGLVDDRHLDVPFDMLTLRVQGTIAAASSDPILNTVQMGDYLCLVRVSVNR